MPRSSFSGVISTPKLTHNSHPIPKKKKRTEEEEEEEEEEMPRSSFSGVIRSPKVELVIDMGHPFLNRTVDGFLKIGTVAATAVAAEEAYHCVSKGNISKSKAEHALKKMCKEGAYWGTVAGVYVGMEYGVERIRGRRDWKNAMLAGALTGAIVSAASKKHGDQIAVDAIKGGAISVAADFLNYNFSY